MAHRSASSEAKSETFHKPLDPAPARLEMRPRNASNFCDLFCLRLDDLRRDRKCCSPPSLNKVCHLLSHIVVPAPLRSREGPPRRSTIEKFVTLLSSPPHVLLVNAEVLLRLKVGRLLSSKNNLAFEYCGVTSSSNISACPPQSQFSSSASEPTYVAQNSAAPMPLFATETSMM